MRVAIFDYAASQAERVDMPPPDTSSRLTARSAEGLKSDPSRKIAGFIEVSRRRGTTPTRSAGFFYVVCRYNVGSARRARRHGLIYPLYIGCINDSVSRLEHRELEPRRGAEPPPLRTASSNGA